jgi:RNA polymerase sigma factor (sigma-70 family)
LAEDAVQEAFFTIVNNPRFRGEANLKTYVHRIVYSKAIDILRREAREHVDSVLVEGILDCRLDPSFRGRTPEELLLLAEKIWWLQDALQSLSNLQKKAFKMVLEEGIPQREAAGILGMHYPTFRSCLFKAKQKLQKKLKPIL